MFRHNQEAKFATGAPVLSLSESGLGLEIDISQRLLPVPNKDMHVMSSGVVGG